MPVNRRTPARVYFIRPIGMQGPIKIGCSMWPGGRRSTLETWSPFPLEIVAEIEGDERLERRFHSYFVETYQRREWFGWSPKLGATIEAINNGSFDVATLPPPAKLPAYTKRSPWSEEQKRRTRYVHKVRRVLGKTGFGAPRDLYGADGLLSSEDGYALLDLYVDAPHLHGRPLNAPWAAALRDAYFASLDVRPQEIAA